MGDEKNLKLKEDSVKLYDMLEKIMALYYQTNQSSFAKASADPSFDGKGNVQLDSDWITKMIDAIAGAGFFNTDRMVEEYSRKIWNI